MVLCIFKFLLLHFKPLLFIIENGIPVAQLSQLTVIIIYMPYLPQNFVKLMRHNTNVIIQIVELSVKKLSSSVDITY